MSMGIGLASYIPNISASSGRYDNKAGYLVFRLLTYTIQYWVN